MQLICSDNRGLEDRLTIGKVYEGNLDKATWFTVTDDKEKKVNSMNGDFQLFKTGEKNN